MRILAQPFFKGKDGLLKGNNNPYTERLYTAIEKCGHSVDHISLSKVLFGHYDIWHRHWPEITLSDKNLPRAVLKTWVFLWLMDWMRFRGTKTVWTIHNLESHERLYPAIEKRFWRAFISRLDGYISLSESGRQRAIEKHPALKNLPGFVIPHGHYRKSYPNTIGREEARSQLGLNPDHKVFLMLGNLRPYKNAPQLIRLFCHLPNTDYRLFVAGSCKFPDVQEALEDAAQEDPRVTVYVDHVPTEEVQVYLKAADLMVLPYSEILNSGSAMLALSFDCPVLVVRKGAMAELQKTIGEDWVYTYEGELTPSILEEGLQWAIRTERRRPAPLDGMEDGAIAQKTIDAFEKICFS